MQRTSSDTPTLVPAQLAGTCAAFADRVHAAFPERGIDRHAHWLAEHADRIAAAGRHAIESPRWLRRVSDVGGIGAAMLLLLTSFLCVRRLGDIDTLPTYLSSLDAFFTVLAATVAGGFTMRSIRHHAEQRRALKGLNTLRSFAHVTDMLQLSKSPTRLLFMDTADPGCVAERVTPENMSEYLSYCAELQSLTAKVAALYGEWTSDAVVHTAIDDVARMCAELENKSLQRLLLLEQIHQRIR